MGRRRGARIEPWVHAMARQRLSALPARDLVAPSSSAAPVAGDGPVAELLPFRRPDLSSHDSDFQRLVSNVVELAQILTGASGSAIAFRGEQGTICRARSGEGAPPLGALVDTTSGISKQCLDSGASLRCDDIATDRRVDPEISQAVRIRAVAVVPIYGSTDVCGILEVFSNAPGVFTDQHLQTLQQLANWVGSAANMPGELPIGDSNSRARLPGSPIQMHEWDDVLLESYIPWKRFIESVFLHIVVIGLLSGLSIIWPRELILAPLSLRAAHITYYPQSFPARESSRPAVHPILPPTSASHEVARAGRDREPLVASGARDTGDGQKVHALTAPPPALPMFASSRFRKPELGAAVLPPPPDIDKAKARQPRLPDLSAVAPPPDLGTGSGLRRITAPRAAVVPPSPDVRGSMKSGLINAGQLGARSARAADISIVPPPPSLNDHAAFNYPATGVIANTGVEVVVPPSPFPARTEFDATATPSTLLGGGVSQVVRPPPSLEGAGNSVGGRRGRANSLAGGGAQVVPPAPSMQNGVNDGEGGRLNSLGQADSHVVPLPPSVQLGARGDSGAAGQGQGQGQGRSGSLAGAGVEGVLPPASAKGDGNSGSGGKPGGAIVAKDATTSSAPEAGADRMHKTFQDVELRVIAVAWAPPRSSFFSSFEVFIAEKWLNKKESKQETEFIKLVYEFLPYQQRLSEYRFNDLKVRRLRVTRDSTCDESLMQMAWHDGENGPSGSHQSGEALASAVADRNNALPCYRTTADDYRRAVSGSR